MGLFEHIAQKLTDVGALVQSEEGVHVCEDDLKFVWIWIWLGFNSNPSSGLGIPHEEVLTEMEIFLVANELEVGGEVAVGDFVGLYAWVHVILLIRLIITFLWLYIWRN